jgi:hypothetical protein
VEAEHHVWRIWSGAGDGARVLGFRTGLGFCFWVPQWFYPRV